MTISRLQVAALLVPMLLSGCSDNLETPKAPAPPVVTIPAPLPASAHGDSHERVIRETIADLKSLASALEGARDEASAKAAAPAVESLTSHLELLRRRDAALPPITEDQRALLNASHSRDNQQAVVDLMLQIKRIKADPKLRGPLNDAIEKFMPSR